MNATELQCAAECCAGPPGRIVPIYVRSEQQNTPLRREENRNLVRHLILSRTNLRKHFLHLFIYSKQAQMNFHKKLNLLVCLWFLIFLNFVWMKGANIKREKLNKFWVRIFFCSSFIIIFFKRKIKNDL